MTEVAYCTPEWLEQSAALYQSDPQFTKDLAKVSARVCFRVKAEPKWGIDKDIIFGAFIKQGELEKLAFFSEQSAMEESDFILAATPQEWKKILRKENKFVTDFMLGKIILEHGSKVGVISLAPQSASLVKALTQVNLKFPDEMSEEELVQYRSYMQEFRQKISV
ncbi:MAG: hypothetical protein IBX69_06735 [Anaerolineales bacterium]|nr:hypothetical protein [Anaerolineales bacterium]